MTTPTHAQDKRTVDPDGRLRVPGCRISKANVCPYYGAEIPGYEALGLAADRVYMMYRDPEELRKAAASFEGVPLLNTHQPVTADSHAPEITVGTITNPRFEYPYLVADLVVWTQDARDLIDTGEQRELSSAYRYTPIMGKGTSPEGLRFDGIMSNLSGNHLALVREGRAGPDVMVADEKPLAMKFPKFFEGIAKLFPAPIPAGTLVALDAALTEEIDAMDEMDDDKKKAACDSYAKELGKDAGSLTDEEKTEAYRRAAADGSAPSISPKTGMDEATVKVTVDAAVAAARAETAGWVKPEAVKIAADAARAEGIAETVALYAARDAVADKAGLVNLTELKTAEAVYRYALDKLTVPHAEVKDLAALAALYTAAARAPTQVVTQDAAPFNVREHFAGLRLISQG